MPLVIRELIVRAIVEPPDKQVAGSPEPAKGEQSSLSSDQVQAVVQQVIEILRRREDR